MASDRFPIVDLTDDSESSSSSSTYSNNLRFNDSSSRHTYLPSALNPAKRSRIDFPTLSPMALLNPRAFVGKSSSSPSSSPARNETQPFPTRAQQDLDRTGISFNKRMESLHNLKDRKIKAP